MRRAALGAAAASRALPAAAQERPVFVPTRDVAVTYRVTAGQGAGHELRMAWLVAERKLRVDAEGAPGWSVIDQRAKRMLVVMEQQRTVLEVPANTGPGGLSLPTEPPASARFTKGGHRHRRRPALHALALRGRRQAGRDLPDRRWRDAAQQRRPRQQDRHGGGDRGRLWPAGPGPLPATARLPSRCSFRPGCRLPGLSSPGLAPPGAEATGR